MGRPPRQSELTNGLPYLSYADSRLTVDGSLDLTEILERSEHPVLLYLTGRATANLKAMREAFEAHFSRVSIFFALKSCYVRPVVEALLADGAGLEVMSHLELRLAQQLGCAPDRVVANGVGRSARHADEVSAGAGLVVVDNPEDLDEVSRAAAAQGTVVPIGLRVTPEVDVERFLGRGGKVGADWAGGRFLDLLDRALSAPGVEVTALHAHQLTHGDDLDRYRACLRGIAEVATEVQRLRGLRFEVIDIGGGLDTRHLLHRGGLDAPDFARVAAEELAVIDYDFELYLEPGRYLVADAAIGLTRVTGQKPGDQSQWRISELGSNILIPLPDIRYEPLPLTWPEPQEPWATYHVADGTCAPSVLAREVPLPTGPSGRSLAVLNCGAYTSVFAECWAFPLPKVLVWDGAGLTTVFGEEDQARMFESVHGYRLDLTPAPLPR
ncbi:diaminopimelate decarboxylase family protein [Streptomyces sp. NPDC060031]|uniref:diaminopimelate decarboxylase family protein n=1 Tax=Streptomyces sp. NPDC060031 TaxID=3347043 RepID=UPI0036B22A04